MRVTIRDRATLNAIRPGSMLSYLRSEGWTTQSEIGDKGVILRRLFVAGEQELVVPTRRDLADFALRMAEVIAALEQTEGRSQEEILADVVTTSFDLIRIRSSSAASGDGSVPIDLGVALFEQAREMVLAAACSTVTPKAYWARRKPKRAIEYLEGVRLGQTERGSYVLIVQSPVPPALRSENVEELPFERQVSRTLVQSLAEVKIAAQQALVNEDFQPFRRGIERGVSANLCDALVSLARATSDNGVEISVTYSRNRPPTEGASHVTTNLSQDLIPVIEEASRVFKQTEPEEDFTLIGYVERLDRALGTPTGRIAIQGVVEERPRRVIVDLPDIWYQEAIQAHREKHLVVCVGELAKEGRSYQLLNPREFESFAPDEPEARAD